MATRRGISDGWIAALYGISAVIALGVFVKGAVHGIDTWMLGGVVGLIVTLTTFPICLLLRHASKGEEETGILDLRRAIELLQENMVLSDDARRVLNRKKEGTLLRGAIEEDIRQGDWDAAMVLVRELAERFGYRTDAEEFRTRIDAARSSTIHQQVDTEIAALDQLIATRQWDAGFAEAARITRVYHESHAVEGLRHRVQTAKERYKQDLERSFLVAAREDRVDEAMALLHEMDGYLSEQEGAQFQEVARGVIGKARENLGAQFKLAVHDHAWDRAEAIGQQILEEFPNTRMAEEIRSMIDTVRQRARGVTR
ncbi:MAG: hypothetical protein JKY96_03840 [Phycisphaerales bacterium]|nr:hypothetical protein [Phycisphaerales bacterium]